MKTSRAYLIVLAAFFLAGAGTRQEPPRSAHAYAGRKTLAACTPKPSPKVVSRPVLAPEESISGTITALSGEYSGDDGEADFHARGVITQYGMTVRASDGSTEDVEMIAGTFVYPPGTRLRWGMRIKALGHMEGCTFIARRITVLAAS